MTGCDGKIEEPRWWKYVEMKDVDGVGVITGFVEGTPKEIIEGYESYQKIVEEAHRNGILI